MNAQFIPQEERSEQEEQRLIKQLRQSIELTHQQMHQLVRNEEDFVQKITHLNNTAKDKINKKSQLEISEALVYLAEAQKILEYAAGCGKNINRQLIICVLHNQACVYQILWQLDQCSNYLQALIFNYETFFKESSEFSVPPSCINPSSQINYEEKMFGFAGGSEISYVSKMRDPQLISRMEVKLLNYYFQHCAVSSQLQKNRKALESAKKGIKLLKTSFTEHRHLLIEEMSHHKTHLNQNIELKYLLLQGLSEMSQQIDINQSKQILKSAYFSLQIWTNNRTLNSSQQMQDHQTEKMKEKLKNLAIGTIMEILPKEFNKMTNDTATADQSEGIFTIEEFILKAFFLSVAYFSVATQLRLLSNLMFKNRKEEDKKNSQQYKESVIYHLIAIIIASLYIPYECRYVLDILASYSKHYSCNLQQYKPVEQQSIQKIAVLLAFKKEEEIIPKNNDHQKLGRSTKETADLNQEDLNQYKMNCNNNLLPKIKLKAKEPLSLKENTEESPKLSEKLKHSKTDLKNSQIKKSRADSKSSRMKRTNSKQTVNTKDKIQTKYNELQKILSNEHLIGIEDGQKSPIKKLKNAQRQKDKSQNQHQQSKDKIYMKKTSEKQKQELKSKPKADTKKIKTQKTQRTEKTQKNQRNQKVQKTQRKTKNSQKKQQQKIPKPNTITEEDQQFFFYMTKKTTKTNANQNGNLFSPKQSIKSIGNSRRSTGKKSSLYSSRSNSKNSPRVFTNIQSPTGSMQSPASKGFLNIKKMNSDKKSPKVAVQAISSSRNYF